ncbi:MULTISPECIES: TPR domain-containing glycosyltransferase [unclassified Paenibacillus]|uniref:TPR domain-containing glycosyltransferase n=1 Tax=unclassified Paenibacillus TaxID=185978 RepID=UPI002473251E|nr:MULTISPECIES: TPR domain-containing glycosyltransferase [unclassified Paenibacillus]MDH6430918.1 glycosyltransferase involved in cell wall biosynthesis/TolA-binding protein [Paenibacillus sp. PastH-4]MDH6446882.1 glycosyltransferase involved in cell wall biosynthesis/TolA-binding protein [Paenibacillus sp. PastF-4]MDH6531035.1 glycosyltransferase involved in cell wall biosynthesis/TolA-binding protein [Paenibacillus sp. PastH-3]
MNNITLGVHLIVNNEADLLPHCLTSVAGVDEIVVIDTGSTDESIAISQAHGARVFQREWTENFAAARNEGLDQADTDWILVLDADERLQTPLPELRSLLQNTQAQAFTVQIDNWLGVRPEDKVKHSAVRLFRNGQGYRYSGRIHEGIDAAILKSHNISAIEHSDIEIEHFGYLPEIMARKNKIKRNEQLLRLALAEQPEDPFHSYNLAVTCCQDGRLLEAETLLRQTLHHVPLEASYRPTMIRDLCKIYLTQGKTNIIDTLLLPELERYEDYPDLHFLLGQSLESQGLLERAFQAYQRAASISGDQVSQKYVSEQGMNTFRPLYRLGLISERLELQEDAARFYHRALQHHSLYRPALQGIAFAFQRLAVPDEEIVGLLIQIVPPTNAAQRAAIIDSLFAINANETITNLSRDTFPLELETANWMISSLLITGKLEDAYTTIRQMTSLATQDNHDLEYLKKWPTLWAICSWALFGEFHNDLLTYVPDELRFGLQYIQKCHQQQKVDPAEAEVDSLPLHSSFISDLIEQSVKLHQPELSDALVKLFPTFRSELAAALYKEGNRNAAGEHFIRLVSDQAADAKVLFYIGEMVFDKGHYTEASEWFQQALEQMPEHEAARVGLALCYLQQAKHSMEEALNSLDAANVHGPLQTDIGAIHKSIFLLNRTPWHTQWSFRQSEGRTAK